MALHPTNNTRMTLAFSVRGLDDNGNGSVAGVGDQNQLYTADIAVNPPILRSLNPLSR